MDKTEPQFNTGLIVSTIPPTAYIAGEYSPLISGIKRVSVPLFWTNYLPKPEVQNANPFDEMNCVTRGTENCYETDYKFQTGLNIDWSDRHIAKISGTTHDGNYVNKPAEAIHDFGLVLEEEYPNKADTWEEYYKTIPLVIPIRAVKILKDWDFEKEYIMDLSRDNLYNKLQENPLGVTVRYASSGNPEDILNPNGNPNHFVMIYGAKYCEYWDIYDSYEWQRGKGVVKRYAWNYNFGNVLRFFITKKTNNHMNIENNVLYQFAIATKQPDNTIKEVGKFAVGLDNKLIVDELDKLQFTWIQRNSKNGLFTGGKTKFVKMPEEEWNEISKVNLKGERV